MKTPLRCDGDGLIYDDNGDLVADVRFTRSNFAEVDRLTAEIVAACNGYAGLVRTLENVERRMVARTDHEANLPSDLQAILAIVRDGLAAVKQPT